MNGPEWVRACVTRLPGGSCLTDRLQYKTRVMSPRIRPFIDHTQAPASLLSDTCLAYYRGIAANPYIQHVLPGFRLSLQTTDGYSPTLASPTEDQVQSERVYWATVAANVPPARDNLADICTDSYGINVLCMMFAFAHGFGRAYDTPLTLDLNIMQAIAMHQSSGLVDALAYLRPTTSLERRVDWFGKIYHPLSTLYTFASRVGMFAPTALVGDTIHHIVHAIASTWRFGLVKPQWVVLSAKINYHVLHWISLFLTLPTHITTQDAAWNTRVCLYWRSSHVAELRSHVQNQSCTQHL